MSAAHVVAVFPPGMNAGALTKSMRRWLSRGEVTAREAGRVVLSDVLAAFGVPAPTAGLATLRYLGQTGMSPDGWLAAADPAHLETRLRHLVLRPFRPGEVTAAELESIAASLRALFADDGVNIEAVDGKGYLHASEAIATAACPADSIAGGLPDEFTPTGVEASSFHRLQSEIQMMLHDHPVNEDRRGRGLPAINTLWIWGGGKAGAFDALQLPALFGDDPLFRGFWASRGQAGNEWIPEAVHAATMRRADAVITMPYGASDAGAKASLEALGLLADALRAGRCGRLSLFFGNHLVVGIRRVDILRVWRGLSPLLQGPEDDA